VLVLPQLTEATSVGFKQTELVVKRQLHRFDEAKQAKNPNETENTNRKTQINQQN